MKGTTLGHWKIERNGCGGTCVHSFVVDGNVVGSTNKDGDIWISRLAGERICRKTSTLAEARTLIIRAHTAAVAARSRKASRKRAPTAARPAREVKK